MQQQIHLLVIDPQNDFCDVPAAYQPANPLVVGSLIQPALPVTGAHEDMIRLSKLINRIGDKLYDIHVTLDSHNPLDIAHPAWWMNSEGNAPAPFTLITAADVENGIWRPRNPNLLKHSLNYVQKLAASGRYLLCIWPEHCLIGHWGHNVHADVALALDNWARRKLEVVHFVTKGSNAGTEHYSAVQAEVPDPRDTSTLLNGDLIKMLAEADRVLIAGEALSHCVANTVTDIANNFGEDNIKKLTLLTDCTSSVTGFENLGTNFIAEMTKRGMQLATSTDIFA